MTCSSCEGKVKSELLITPHVLSVEISKEKQQAVIEMDKHIPFAELQKAVANAGAKYTISEMPQLSKGVTHNDSSWFKTYKPIILIFLYIIVVTSLVQLKNPAFNFMEWMRHFMAGFFLVFSFFKLLDLKGFAESYRMYDVVAKQIPAWGYVYALIEFGLGFAYLADYNPLITNMVTFIVMGVSIIGVLQSVLNKRKIQCACLGAVFNLPMSTVTIIEDALMIIMSGYMLIRIF